MGQLQYKFTKCWCGQRRHSPCQQSCNHIFYCCMIHPVLVHFRLVMSLTWDSQTQQWLPLSSKALLYMVQSSSPAAHANGESPSLGEDLHYYIQFQKRLDVSSTFNSILTVVPLQQKLKAGSQLSKL
jgi:hypothetical protein